MAPGSSDSSELGGPRCAPIVQVHTQECLDEIRNMQGEYANVIILFGRTGVGKSALLEYITNTSGHSKQSDNPATMNFQIEPVKINDKKYYIMDTPGFDTNKEQEVFLEIIRGIKAIGPYAKIIGIMLVTRINDYRAEAVDNKLVDFIDKFCGNKYMPQVTVVTTFWNVSEDEEKLEFDERLQSRLQCWRRTLGQDLKQYQHGRQYQNGSDTGACLRWRRDRVDISQYAKEMVSRHYGNIDPQDPQIVQELRANSPEKTAAGKFLKLSPIDSSFSTPFSSSSTATSSSEQPTSGVQPELPPSQKSSPKTSPDKAPRTSASTAGAPDPEAGNRNWNQDRDKRPQNEEQNSFWVDMLFKGGKWVFDKVILPKAEDFLNSGGGGGGAATGRVGGFPNNLDSLSSVDHFRARGLPTDLGYRTRWAQQRGIRAEPGSSAFGDAVRNAIMRESPL